MFPSIIYNLKQYESLSKYIHPNLFFTLHDYEITRLSKIKSLIVFSAEQTPVRTETGFFLALAGLMFI